jgi:hypothetical protein
MLEQKQLEDTTYVRRLYLGVDLLEIIDKLHLLGVLSENRRHLLLQRRDDVCVYLFK